MNKSLIIFLMLFASSPSWALTISGKILDEDQEPLMSATVHNKSTGIGAVTDENGNYSIDVSSYDNMLEFSYVSHTPFTIQAGRLTDNGTVILNWDTNIPAVDILPEYTNDILNETKNCDCGTEWNDEKQECTKWETDSCTALNATKTIRLCVDGHDFCAIQECADNYRLNKNKNVCVSVNGMPCNKDISDDANAELATYDENGKCIVRSCKPGFDMNTTTGQCVAREKADIDALQESTDITTANEQSMGNKLKTAVGMGATGIGGMMIGSGLAEQFADDEAYADMRAYVETFRCEYGSGQTARGGQTNVDLPGGNELTDAYIQYATLANDLKIRKQALNIRPGIESDIIIDKADSGLYDNAGTGLASGGYASIARAILNPGDSDSEKLKTQRNDSADKLEVGTGLAGGGIAGSILINKSQK